MSNDLFRKEAVDHHASGKAHGDILRLDTRWIRKAYLLVVAFAVVGFLYLSLFSFDEYAAGPAVIRIDGRRMVNALAAGNIESIDVKPGQLVAAGQVLLRMSNTEEQAQYQNFKNDFNASLVRLLRNPNDAQARAQIPTLRAHLDQAKALLDQRIIRAPVAGYVSDVRAQAGHHVSPGDLLTTVAPKDTARISLVAMVAADYLPMLRTGAKMRFELDGFHYEYADLEVEEVSSEAIGTVEVQRFLGSERVGAVQVDPGAKVLVSTHLPSATFSSEGQAYGYFDGLTGNASIRVRREPILFSLIPALRSLAR